jgi:opacity protein-like surface antigen
VSVGIAVSVAVSVGVNVGVGTLVGVNVSVGVGVDVNVGIGVYVSVGAGVLVDARVGVGVLVDGAVPTLTISCGLFAPSLLDRSMAVLFVEVIAKLTKPLPLTSEVTSAVSHVPPVKDAGISPETTFPKAGAVL